MLDFAMSAGRHTGRNLNWKVTKWPAAAGEIFASVGADASGLCAENDLALRVSDASIHPISVFHCYVGLMLPYVCSSPRTGGARRRRRRVSAEAYRQTPDQAHTPNVDRPYDANQPKRAIPGTDGAAP